MLSRKYLPLIYVPSIIFSCLSARGNLRRGQESANAWGEQRCTASSRRGSTEETVQANVAMRSAAGKFPDMSEYRIDGADMSDRAEVRALPNTSSESTSGFAASWTQCAEQHLCYLFFKNDFVSSKRAPDLP